MLSLVLYMSLIWNLEHASKVGMSLFYKQIKENVKFLSFFPCKAQC